MANIPCRCGSRLPRIERIEGRAAELFWTCDGKRFQMLNGVVFHNAVDSLRFVREWQAVQVERNRIEFRLELLPQSGNNSDDIAPRLLKRLRDFGVPTDVIIDVQVVPRLLPDATTGKFRRMIRQVNEPAELDVK